MHSISDMTKTKVLRFFLGVGILILIMACLITVDLVAEWHGWPRVEMFVFWAVVIKKVRGWLGRRVWIGTQAAMLP